MCAGGEAKIEMNLLLSQLAHLNKLENVIIITVGLKKASGCCPKMMLTNLVSAK